MGGGPQLTGIEAMKEQYGQISARVDGHVALLEIDRPPNNFVSVDLVGSPGTELEFAL